MNHIKVFLLMFAIGMMAGCAVSTDSGVMAGQPATTSDEETEIISDSNLPRTIAVLPFQNETDSEFAYEVVRRTIANHFSTSNYRMLHWRDVDTRLQLAGLESSEAVSAKSHAEIRDILGVDGLIYGDVTHYEKTFAAVAARISVGVDLKFVNASDEVIWQVSNVQKSYAGGVATTPVGLIMNALLAARHIYGDINLYRAADDLGRSLATQLPQPESVSQRAKPMISNVVHSGVSQYLNYGDTLEIGIEGAPGMTAVASIDGIGLIDLTEAEPGQYVGKIALDKKHNVTDTAVIGRLQDEFGQTSSWVSPYGLLNVDNTPPPQVGSIEAESRDNGIALAWQAPAASDVAGYEVSWSQTETGEAVATVASANSNLALSPVPNFQPAYVSVVAIDRAGNRSEAAQVMSMAAPDPRYSSAEDIDTTIPEVLSGTFRLTASGSPYYLRNSSRIATDGVVFIEPGVQIVVSPAGRLSVLGEIHAFGNNEHHIWVTGEADNTFDEFLILQSTRSMKLGGLHIEGAGIPIQITAGSPLISDSVFSNSAFNAITVDGSARPVISNCKIDGAKATGVLVSGQAQPEFKNNHFANNEPFHLQNGSTYELDLSGNQFEPPASEMTVLGNVSY